LKLLGKQQYKRSTLSSTKPETRPLSITELLANVHSP
jgi:hypothetical protein